MRTIAIMCACAVLLPAMAHANHHNLRKSQIAAVTQKSSFQGTHAWTKLSPSMQQAWLAAEKADDMGRVFQAYARVQGTGGGMGDENFLQSKGFNVRIFSGDVARGSVAAGNLQAVAELPFVEAINLIQ